MTHATSVAHRATQIAESPLGAGEIAQPDAAQSDFDAYFVKPVDAFELIEAVDALLAKAPRTRT